MTLPRLPRHQAAEMTGRVAHGKALPAEVVEQVVAKTDGVPLFVEELTKMVLESGLLQEREERYELTGPLPPLAIPATLHDSLMARLDRLAAVKGLAQLGATLGREFSYALLQAVARRGMRGPCSGAAPVGGGGVPVSAGAAAAGDLPLQACPDPGSGLSVLAAEHPPAVPSAHCPGVGGAISRERRDAARAGGPSLYRGGLHEQAIGYWQRAGQQASDRSANLEAISHFTTGIELLKTLPETPERTQQALALYIALGAALQMAKGQAAPEVEHAYTQARALCQQVGETPELVPVLFGLWRFYLVRSQLHTARELGETLLRLAQRADDPALTVIAHYALGATWFWLGALPAARQHLEEGIARYTPAQRRAPVFRMGQDPGVACRAYRRADPLVAGVPGASPGPPPRGPGVGTRSCRIPIVWRMRGVGRPSSLSFAGTCRPCTSRQRPRSRSRPSRAFPNGRPMERACVGGRWPCRTRARRGWPRSARGSPPGGPPGQR